MGQIHSSCCSVSGKEILGKSWLLCSEMDVPKNSREQTDGNFSEKVKITFNHTCKILCDIWVKHLDSAEFFIVTVI